MCGWRVLTTSSRNPTRTKNKPAIMFPLKKVLFPVDFSDRCRGAAAYVKALVGRFDAELILLHVVEATYNSALEDSHEVHRRDFEKFFGIELKHMRVKKLVEHGE